MNTLRLFLGYAKNYLGALAVSVLSMLLLVAAQLVAPWIIRTMIASITHPEGQQNTMDLMPKLALLALVVYVARGGLWFLRSYMTHVAGWGVVADSPGLGHSGAGSSPLPT